MAKSAKQKAAEAAFKASQKQSAAVQSAQVAAAKKPASAPAPAAAPPAPAQPAAVDPFFTADDLLAIGAFNTDLQTKLTGIDTDLTNAETDTAYQKTQTDTAAKGASSSAQDDAISRGIFQSSIKDATLYDIEAQRSLSSKFLDDKLTTARLNAGSNKQTLSTAKTNFDTNMATKKVQNAQGVNDQNSSAWAAAQAAWAAANPQAAAPSGPAPALPSFAPPKGSSPGATVAQSTSTPKPANVATSTGSTNPKPALGTPKKPAKPKVIYGR